MNSLKKCCIYCDSFYNESELKNHHLICENNPLIFKEKERMKKMEEMDVKDATPSVNELYAMILKLNEQVQTLTDKNQHLQKEIHNLKVIANSRFKRNLLEYLNNLPLPAYTFKEWLRNTFTIELKYLYQVFENDLIDGMKLFLEEKIKKEGIGTLPIRFFKEKQDNVFIYTNEEQKNKWKMSLKTEFSHIVEHLYHEFMKTYYTWQKDNETKINSFEEKDIIVAYSLKINGGSKAKQERTKNELQRWFFALISSSS